MQAIKNLFTAPASIEYKNWREAVSLELHFDPILCVAHCKSWYRIVGTIDTHACDTYVALILLTLAHKITY